MQDAEARLHQKDFVGTVSQGWLGFSVTNWAKWKDVNAKGHHNLIQEELCMDEEDKSQVRAVSMTSQGKWTFAGAVSREGHLAGGICGAWM